MIIHNPILTGSFTVNGTDVASITSSAASITAINAYTASQNILNGTYATTGSNTFKNPQTINSNLIVTGSITAATLVVQTITSSVVYSSGSNVFGNNIANTQTFTGSLLLTGSMGIGTIPQDCQLHITGSSPVIRIGGARTYLLQTVDTDGRFRIHDNTGGERFTIASGSGFVGIGTIAPNFTLHIDSNTAITRFQITNSTTGQGGSVGLQIIQSGSDASITNRSNGYLAFETVGTERMIIASDGSMGFGRGVLSSRSFVFQGLTSRPLVIEAIENANVHSIYLRPNNSGFNLISSNYQSGGVYLPLSLSGRENNNDLVVTTNGNVAIGTSTPLGRFDVYRAAGLSGTAAIVISSGESPSRNWSLNTDVVTDGDFAICVSTATGGTPSPIAGNTKFYLTKGGNAYFGNTAGGTIGGMVQIDALNGLGSGYDGLGVKTGGAVNAIPLLLWNAHTTGDIEFARFYSGASSNRGNIFYSTTNGQLRFSGAAAGTYSDARLKDIKGECSYGLDTISKIKVYDFNWLRNGTKGFGVKAQELYNLIPEVVEVGNDKEIDPMEFDYQDIWKVNYNELVPVLVKAIQELQAQITELKNK